MPKANILDRIAKDLDVLNSRKFGNRNQRIATAQRWNSLSNIANKEIERLAERQKSGLASDYINYMAGRGRLRGTGLIGNSEFKAENPFLSSAPSFDEGDLRLLANYAWNAAINSSGDSYYYAKNLFGKIQRYLDDLDDVRGPVDEIYIDD